MNNTITSNVSCLDLNPHKSNEQINNSNQESRTQFQSSSSPNLHAMDGPFTMPFRQYQSTIASRIYIPSPTDHSSAVSARHLFNMTLLQYDIAQHDTSSTRYLFNTVPQRHHYQDITSPSICAFVPSPIPSFSSIHCHCLS
jgi:hypothetical protein